MHHAVSVCPKVCQYEEIRKEIATHQVTVTRTQAKWLRVWTLHTASHPSRIVKTFRKVLASWLELLCGGRSPKLSTLRGACNVDTDKRGALTNIYRRLAQYLARWNKTNAEIWKFARKNKKKSLPLAQLMSLLLTEILRYKKIKFRTCSYTLLLALSNCTLRTKGGEIRLTRDCRETSQTAEMRIAWERTHWHWEGECTVDVSKASGAHRAYSLEMKNNISNYAHWQNIIQTWDNVAKRKRKMPQHFFQNPRAGEFYIMAAGTYLLIA